jgi:hypothetical protein
LFNKIKRIEIILFIILTLIFSFNLSQGLNTRDSGEFLVAGANLDITHPPGTPIYAIIAKIFFFLGGIKGIIFMSAFFSALSFLIILKMFDNNKLIIGLFLLNLFLNKTFFYFSTTAEVYTLNLFLFSLLLYFTHKKNSYLASFSYGLACTLAPVNVLLFFPIGLKAFIECKRKVLFKNKFKRNNPIISLLLSNIFNIIKNDKAEKKADIKIIPFIPPKKKNIFAIIAYIGVPGGWVISRFAPATRNSPLSLVFNP